MVARKTKSDPVERSRAVSPAGAPRAPEQGNSDDARTSRDALHEFAEAFGRRVARRVGDRRGFGVVGLLVGGLVAALIVILLYHATHGARRRWLSLSVAGCDCLDTVTTETPIRPSSGPYLSAVLLTTGTRRG